MNITYSVYGPTREAIETQAAKTAADYFGDTPHRVKIGTVEPSLTLGNHEVTLWVAPGVKAWENVPPRPLRPQHVPPEPRGSSAWWTRTEERPPPSHGFWRTLLTRKPQ